MKVIKCLLASLLLISNFFSYAEEETTQTTGENLTPAYISDDLFIYMHAGPGNNYRILGSINAGDEVSMTGESANGYTQIIDSKNRETWVESKYVSTTPGIRAAIAELNGKLASNEDSSLQLSSELTQANNQLLQTQGNYIQAALQLIQAKSNLDKALNQ